MAFSFRVRYAPRTFVLCWIDILCALVGIALLGFYRPNWDIRFLAWHGLRDYNKHQKKKKRN